MTTSTKTKSADTGSVSYAEFDIHQKLKSRKSSLTHMYLAQPHQSDVKCDFHVNLIDMEFSLYKRVGNYFILVDFFSDINEACPEALKILEEWPQAKNSILGWMEHARNN
ncbi:hypothetical protein [Pantoea sp. BAV 3049]|uniref:hypothetical protein n=1 Tax=Pantoea sp. BAV 3049 TaxID=2654188 RepID=UPI00131DABB4|nr:hypothetical protein [Pantoea sp. BAV 3049]